MKRKLVTVVVAVVVVAALVSPAGAAGTITITSPADGASISRSATPQIALAGTVAFAAPVPVERKFYMVGEHRTSCNTVTTPGGGTCPDRLILEPKDESSQRDRLASQVSVGSSCTTLGCVNNWQTMEPGSFSGENSGVPYTLDTSNPVTGVFTLRWDDEGVALSAGQAKVTFELTGVTGGQEVSLGETSASKLVLPGAAATHEFSFSIQTPAEFNKKDFTYLWLETRVGGTYRDPSQTTHTRPFVVQGGASYMVVPGYSASFGPPSVQVAVDRGAYSSQGTTLSPDLTSWSGSVPTPKRNGGPYTIKARALQGVVPLAETSMRITVTD